jgi:hypothetical protein
MQKLRRSGSTFSTSGKRWFPFRGNLKVARRNGRLHKLIKAGVIEPMSKADMRTACDAAVMAKRKS